MNAILYSTIMVFLGEQPHFKMMVCWLDDLIEQPHFNMDDACFAFRPHGLVRMLSFRLSQQVLHNNARDCSCTASTGTGKHIDSTQIGSLRARRVDVRISPCLNMSIFINSGSLSIFSKYNCKICGRYVRVRIFPRERTSSFP
jgi:hypothetical protein